MYDAAAYTVLVVEDERDLLMMVAQHLVDEGYQTLTASIGSAALSAIRTERPDLVLLDVMMPGFLSGLHVLSLVRADGNPDLAATPIIMLTAIADQDHVMKAIRDGATDYLTKPFKLRELTARVERILRQ